MSVHRQTINRMTRERDLQRAHYADRLIITSEEFDNVAYEAAGDAVCVMQWVDGRIRRPWGDVDDMRRLADEIIDVCDLREGLKDWGAYAAHRAN